MSAGKHKVFIYGTLKRGQPNEHFMGTLESVTYLCDVRTKNTYPLIIGGPWNLPLLLNVQSKGKHVLGELYEVNDKDLKRMDEFEGHPDFYYRTEIEVTQVEGNDHAAERCWVYFITKFTDSDLELEHHESYDNNGDHGLKYDVREAEEGNPYIGSA